MTVHSCRESENPRFAGRCACGKRLVEADRPSAPAVVRRNLQLEREITYEAAKGVCDPDRLIIHSETRARTLSGEYVESPGLIVQGRDRLRDVREELSDGRNHLVWWLQANIGDERCDDAMIALRFICLAYDRLLDN